MEITARYTSIDGYSEARTYKTLAGAACFCLKWLGPCFESFKPYQGITYDGIGKVSISGCPVSLVDLVEMDRGYVEALALYHRYRGG